MELKILRKRKKRSVLIEQFPVANIRDIIASKKASGRAKDLNDLPLLEDFRIEFEKKNARRTEIRSGNCDGKTEKIE